MTTLQKYDSGLHPEIIKKLSPGEQRIARYTNNNRENPKYSEMNQQEVKSVLETILYKAKIKLGLKSSSNDSVAEKENQLLMEVIDHDLEHKFPNLTRLEIYAALDAGLDGEFLDGDETRVFFNPSNFVRWIKAWIEKVKKPVMKKVLDTQHNLKEAEPVISEREQLTSRFTLFLGKCLQMREGQRFIDDFGGVLYDFLLKFNKVEPVTIPEIEECLNQKIHETATTSHKSEWKVFTEALINLEQGVVDMETNPAIPLATRRIVRRKINELSGFEDDDFIFYFECFREEIIEYLKENNL